MNNGQGNPKPNNGQRNPKPNNGQGNLNQIQFWIKKIININGKVKNFPDIQKNFLLQLSEVVMKTRKEVDKSIALRNILKLRASQIVRYRNTHKGLSDEKIAEKYGLMPFKSIQQYIPPRKWEEEMNFAINNAVNTKYQEHIRIARMYNLIKNQANNGEVLNETKIKKSIQNIIHTNTRFNQQKKLMNLLKKTSKSKTDKKYK